jgi:crotonobetainyl-CoA:carnitine CoA-transferase CaiB-like acyl-CoA transferase
MSHTESTSYAESDLQQTAPLHGLTVLDLTVALAGPYATLLLAGLGATVIKLENPGRGGDHARNNAPYLGSGGMRLARTAEDDMSLAMLDRGRNKLSATLNLKHPRARELFGELVQQADVVVENYAAGTADRLGIGYDFCSALNERIIYTAISGFGAARPARKGMDTIFQALSGMMTVSGNEADPPIRCGVPFGDMTGPLFAVIGTLAALHHRERTGRGQFVDVSLVGALSSMVAAEPFDKLEALGVPTRTGNTLPRLAPFGIFPTADGSVAICAPSDEFARGVFVAMDEPELSADPRFATRDARVAHWIELHARIGRWSAARPTDAVVGALDGRGVPVAPVRTPADAVRDPDRLAQGDTAQLTHPSLGPVEDLYGSGLPIRFSDAHAAYDRPAPWLGEHNGFVYGGMLGRSADEIRSLADDGAI